MRKTLLFVFTIIAAVCLSVGITGVKGGASAVRAERVEGVTPTLSATKFLESIDKKNMLLATGIKNYEDCYEVGYELNGLEAVKYDKGVFYTSISINGGGKSWATEDLFPEYDGMIVWEVERDLYADVSFRAYAKVGEREDGVLYESDTIVYGTQRQIDSDTQVGKVMLSSGFDIALPDYDPANATTLEFDIYVTASRSPYTKVYWNLCDASDNYFGYYRLTYAGKQAVNVSGYSADSIDTDTFHVTLVLSELAGGSGTPGKLVRLKDNGSSVNLDGAWIDNIEFKYPVGRVMLSSGFDIELPDYNPANATTLEFDIYVTASRSPYTKVYWNLCDASDNYFGYYRLTYAGKQAVNVSGYSADSIDTDTFHVTLVLSELAGGSGTPGKLVKIKDNGSSVNLDGAWIDNIEFCEGSGEPVGKVMLSSGFDIALPDYDPANATTLEFDIYVTAARSPYTKVYWNLCDASDNYFGYYRLTYAGKQAVNVSGYSADSIDTDTFHVTLVLSELAGGSGTPGKLVKIKDNGSSVNLDGAWIDNIEFKN